MIEKNSKADCSSFQEKGRSRRRRSGPAFSCMSDNRSDS